MTFKNGSLTLPKVAVTYILLPSGEVRTAGSLILERRRKKLL
jgi:hypothetical protein